MADLNDQRHPQAVSEALHQPHFGRCSHDGEPWPCPTRQRDEARAEVDRLRSENKLLASCMEADAEEVARLRAVEEWAQDAPHHDGCAARYEPAWACTCGRDEVMPRD